MGRKVLRVALIGGGRMALQHATAIRLRPHAALVAVADPLLAAADIHARFGPDVAAFADAGEMLESVKPDVVHIVTPPASHGALAKACLASGAHVYVEKPFAVTLREADEILALAQRQGLKVCPAHQVLFQRAGQQYRKYLPAIGQVVHIESYFSFRPVRRRPDGGAPLSPVEQLVDILPHPVYLMLDALRGQAGATEPTLSTLDVSPSGEVRAVIRAGEALATLIVTLRGRPVESYLRVVGTNGSVTADFVLGALTALPGPGASAPAAVIRPFSQAWQVATGSIAGLARLIFRRQKSYPGLAELLDRFYTSVAGDCEPPIDDGSIRATVRICEEVAARLQSTEAEAEAHAQARLADESARLPPADVARGTVLVTGGTGFLGRVTVQALRASGWAVRVAARRPPAMRQRVAGVEYVTADLGSGVDHELLRGVSVVVHLAAETAGNQQAHERNTVIATKNLLDAMAATGVSRLINASSVAVLKPAASGILEESTAVDRGNRSRGPYVWAKAEAESLASERAAQGDMQLRTIRLGPLVDLENFTPPGRLGREVVRLFVAVGHRANVMSVCDVGTAAKVICHHVEHFERAPAVVNLVEVPAPTRGELVDRLRATRPDLKVMWLPFFVLRLLSLAFVTLMRILRPGRQPLDLYSAFKSERYAARAAGEVIVAARGQQLPPTDMRVDGSGGERAR